MMMSQTRRLMLAAVLAMSCTFLSSCGGGGNGGSSGSSGGNGSSSGGATGFTVGGTIAGLGNSTGLVLANGNDTLQVAANSTNFTMPTAVANGDSYSVTVKANATAIQCSVSNGAGTVDSANVTNISVFCQAGTESVLHSFAGGSADGAIPDSLIQALDGSFNGVTEEGGANGQGVLFNLTPSGTTETVLYSFSTGTPNPSYGNIIQAMDGNFYGVLNFAGLTPPPGSDTHTGIVYKINPAGTSETNVYSFSLAGGTTEGAYPQKLIQATDGNFYGVASVGGANNDGVFFRMTPSGTETVLYSFAGSADGAFPVNLIQAADGNFYGVAINGGASGKGVLFKVTPSGTETVLHPFAGGSADGSFPDALIQATDGNFYGVASGGGAYGAGVLFKVTPSGAETVLHSFAGGSADGGFPNALIQATDGNFYGVASGGGANGEGVLFKVIPSGTETVLHSFAGGPSDGANPSFGFIQATNGGLYGTTTGGGANNDGTVFEFN